MVTALAVATTLGLVLSGGTSPASSNGGQGGVSATAAPSTGKVAPRRHAYPVRGAHQYWDGMGAGRGHQGVDIGSRCGTPLVAARAGRVRYVKYHPSAGHYLVLDTRGSNLDLVYMHMKTRAIVRPGQRIAAGRPIGRVGDTGNASGCHLHFEVWKGTYYGGGSPIDPMPFLAAWDRGSRRLGRRS